MNEELKKKIIEFNEILYQTDPNISYLLVVADSDSGVGAVSGGGYADDIANSINTCKNHIPEMFADIIKHWHLFRLEKEHKDILSSVKKSFSKNNNNLTNLN